MGLALGPIIYTAVKPIFKIYLIIACGFFLGKRNVLTVETSRNLSDIIITLILPCLIFTKIVTYLENSDIKQIGIICLVYTLQTVIGGLGGLACYMVGKPQYWLGGCLSVALMPNISDLPIAYLQTFAQGMVFTEDEGEKGVAYICMFTAFQIVMQFNCGLFKLTGYDFDVQRRAQKSMGNIEKHETEEESSGHDDVQSQAVEDYRSYNSSNSHNNDEDDEEEEEEEDSMDYHDRIIPLTDNHSGMERTQSRVSNLSLRRNRSQSMNELVREYSQAASMREGMHAVPAKLTELETVPTNTDDKPKHKIASKSKAFILFTLDNCKRPISVALIIAMVVSMVPWLKALFVTSDQVTLPNAPDSNPPLSFLMDFTSYIANACVPLGLLILGATLSRLQISTLNFQTILAPLLLSFLRLIIMPIIGCAIIAGFARLGWFKDDDMLRFVSSITWGLPNATSLIYLTAFYTPLEGNWRQMDTLALTYIIQYPILSITLPFLTTYVIKCGLSY